MKSPKRLKTKEIKRKEPDPKEKVKTIKKDKKQKNKKKLSFKEMIRKLPKPIKLILFGISVAVVYTGIAIAKVFRFIYKKIIKPTFRYIKNNLISFIIALILILALIIGYNITNNLKVNLEEIKDQRQEDLKTQEQLVTDVTQLKQDIEGKSKEIEEKDAKIKELEKQVTSRGSTTVRTATTNSNSTTIKATGTVSEYQAYAKDLCINTYSWSENDFQCLVKLWNRESNWNPNAHNKSSGAHGIPQSLPASKMASEGADYYTNGKTQIRWGLKYIKNRYGNPANAWAHSQNTGWY